MFHLFQVFPLPAVRGFSQAGDTPTCGARRRDRDTKIFHDVAEFIVRLSVLVRRPVLVRLSVLVLIQIKDVQLEVGVDVNVIN